MKLRKSIYGIEQTQKELGSGIQLYFYNINKAIIDQEQIQFISAIVLCIIYL